MYFAIYDTHIYTFIYMYIYAYVLYQTSLHATVLAEKSLLVLLSNLTYKNKFQKPFVKNNVMVGHFVSVLFSFL
jgi:hypothetical protein